MAGNELEPRFDWSLVRSFLAVLDAGSLSAAARRLGAQQPTLSRQPAALEAQPGRLLPLKAACLAGGLPGLLQASSASLLGCASNVQLPLPSPALRQR